MYSDECHAEISHCACGLFEMTELFFVFRCIHHPVTPSPCHLVTQVVPRGQH